MYRNIYKDLIMPCKLGRSYMNTFRTSIACLPYKSYLSLCMCMCIGICMRVFACAYAYICTKYIDGC